MLGHEGDPVHVLAHEPVQGLEMSGEKTMLFAIVLWNNSQKNGFRDGKQTLGFSARK